MNKPYPAFCKDCKYSAPETNSDWNLMCHNPIVNANDSWALSNSFKNGGGTSCSRERDDNGWFSKCGTKGKLWETKK